MHGNQPTATDSNLTLHAAASLVTRRGFCAALAAVSAGLASSGSQLWADQAADDLAKIDAMTQKAMEFLVKRQAADGSFTQQAGIGITALVAWSLLKNGRTAKDPVVAKSLAFLEKAVQPDGGIHGARSRLPNYETCVCLMAFHAANAGGKYDKVIQGAEGYIRKGQWDESEGKESADEFYGGAGYGGPSRPDLSNTAFLIDALKETGAGPDDEALKKALVFVSRCQNLETEHNTTPFAAKVNDGGFYYTCAVGDEEKTRAAEEGGLKSYGAMSYSGLKSMLYAGVDKNDPRVKAAVAWIQKNYDVKSHPGMGDAGLYYYYHTFSKALDALGEAEIKDASGKTHNWRRELLLALADRQQPDGSWANTNARWMEGDPSLATAFALLALAYCRPPQAKE